MCVTVMVDPVQKKRSSVCVCVYLSVCMRVVFSMLQTHYLICGFQAMKMHERRTISEEGKKRKGLTPEK